MNQAVAAFPFAVWDQQRLDVALQRCEWHAVLDDGALLVQVFGEPGLLVEARVELMASELGARLVVDFDAILGDPSVLGEALDQLVVALDGWWDEPDAPLRRRFDGWETLRHFYRDWYEEEEGRLLVRVDVAGVGFVVQVMPWPVLPEEDWLRMVCVVGDPTSSPELLAMAADSPCAVFLGPAELGVAMTMPVDALDPLRFQGVVVTVAEAAHRVYSTTVRVQG